MKKHSSVLINCSNLHNGGGVAVATSFIYSISRKVYPDVDISVICSSSVHTNLVALGADLNAFKCFTVINFVGARSLWQKLDNLFLGHDVVFTIFGPSYFLRKRTYHICGFAQPSIIYPNNIVLQGVKLLPRLKISLKYKLQEIFFQRADEIIVELDHVKIGLRKKLLFKDMPIHIVNSTVDEIFKEPSRWLPVSIPTKPNVLRLGVISRNYHHKNLVCLPFLKARLKELFSIDADFFVTFTDKEWLACSDFFKSSINNIGSIKLAHCPTFYAAMDGVIFPSLLECFSAVPIEAMMMQKPVFASNLPFIVDCCHEHANYFDPHDVDSMAKSISSYFGADKLVQNEFLRSADEFVRTYPDANARADAYMKIILSGIGITS